MKPLENPRNITGMNQHSVISYTCRECIALALTKYSFQVEKPELLWFIVIQPLSTLGVSVKEHSEDDIAFDRCTVYFKRLEKKLQIIIEIIYQYDRDGFSSIELSSYYHYLHSYKITQVANVICKDKEWLFDFETEDKNKGYSNTEILGTLLRTTITFSRELVAEVWSVVEER
ncbi:hypothetical protein K501DRAFT_273518 [Backusella circina FSU 941]|nr:hypothetical protein K501DRAFT_273518 [Backusella circina FSU 941]